MHCLLSCGALRLRTLPKSDITNSCRSADNVTSYRGGLSNVKKKRQSVDMGFRHSPAELAPISQGPQTVPSGLTKRGVRG